MITFADLRNEIDIAVKAGGLELAEEIDVDAVAFEIIDRYGLISIDAKTEDDERVIDHDEFWEIVSRHDATRR